MGSLLDFHANFVLSSERFEDEVEQIHEKEMDEDVFVFVVNIEFCAVFI